MFYNLDHTCCKQYKDVMFFLNLWHFRVFTFSIFIANIAIDFHHWKYFSIILPFFLHSVGENKFVYSNKSNKNYLHIIESYAYIL